MPVNNVTRMLDARKIPYTAFELPDEKLGALETSQILGISPELVYKTIVVTRAGKGKPILAVVSGSSEVDLKLLAKAVGDKKVLLAPQRKAEQLTGLLAGGISPLALLNRGFQVVLDESVRSRPEIHISGGQRGLNICIAVEALVKLTNASIAQISH